MLRVLKGLNAICLLESNAEELERWVQGAESDVSLIRDASDLPELFAWADLAEVKSLAVADGQVQLLEQLSTGGRASPWLTRERLSLEATERSLAGARVVIVGEDLSLWTGKPPLPESSE